MPINESFPTQIIVFMDILILTVERRLSLDNGQKEVEAEIIGMPDEHQTASSDDEYGNMWRSASTFYNGWMDGILRSVGSSPTSPPQMYEAHGQGKGRSRIFVLEMPRSVSSEPGNRDQDCPMSCKIRCSL